MPPEEGLGPVGLVDDAIGEAKIMRPVLGDHPVRSGP